MKKKLPQYIIVSIVFLFLVCACKDESEVVVPQPVNTNAIEFDASIDNQMGTRAMNATWAYGDLMGVYTLPAGDTTTLYENSEYRYNGSNFTYCSYADRIYYPSDGSKVDFVAYYPYSDSIMQQNANGSLTDTLKNVLKVDVSNQNIPANIDLLYSNNAKGYDATNTNVSMIFKHQLHKVLFAVSSDTGALACDLTSLSVELKGMPSQGFFSLISGQFTDLGINDYTANPITVDTALAQFEVLMIPTAATTGRSFVFRTTGGYSEWTIPSTLSFDAGNTNVFEVTLSKTQIKVITTSVNDWTQGATILSDTTIMNPKFITTDTLVWDTVAGLPNDTTTLMPDVKTDSIINWKVVTGV